MVRRSGDGDIKILLVDNQEVVRLGMKTLLESEPDISIVEETEEGLEALRLATEHAPDVMVIEMDLPDVSGIEIAKQMSDNGLDIPILAYSAYDDRHYVQHVLKNGIAGYVMKHDSPALLLEAIRELAQGRAQWMSPRVAEKARQVEEERRAVSEEVDDCGLTPREWEILIQLTKGSTAEEISDELFIAKSTVRSHLGHIYEKLDVNGHREAVVWAARHGLIE